MFIRSTVFGTCLLIAAGSASAHENDAKDAGDAYIGEGAGRNIITTGSGGCLRSSGWSEDGQINSCEGIEDVVEEPVEEPVEVPEVVVEAPKEPESQTETVASSAITNFATDSSVLTEEARNSILAVMDELGSLDNIGSLTVTGYTDSRGSEAYNKGLSERRAQTVADLISTRVPNADMEVIGLGESNAIASNVTPEGRLQNRRVEVLFEGTRIIFN